MDVIQSGYAPVSLHRLFWALLETIRDVLPIAVLILGSQVLVIRRRIPHLRRVLVGFVCVILGLAFFLVGLEEALFPLGRSMANQLTATEFIYGSGAAEATSSYLHRSAETNWMDYLWVYVFALAVGFSAVLVEPAVIAVALKANQLSGGAIGVQGLRIAIAVGVGVGIAIGAFRIVTGGSLHYFIIAAYAVVVAQTFFAPKEIIPIAYDSGGVSTSTVTVPLVAALGLGLASGIPGRSELLDGFGLIAFAVLFPIIAVMAYAQLAMLWAWWSDRIQREK